MGLQALIKENTKIEDVKGTFDYSLDTLDECIEFYEEKARDNPDYERLLKKKEADLIDLTREDKGKRTRRAASCTFNDNDIPTETESEEENENSIAISSDDSSDEEAETEEDEDGDAEDINMENN